MKIILLILAFLNITAAVYGQNNDDYLIPFSEVRGSTEYFGYETKERSEVIKAEYRTVDTDKFYKMAIVQRDDGQWVGIDRSGKILFYPFIYDNGPDFVFEGLFRIVENEKIGFANLNGDIVITPEFDYAGSFKEGLAEFAFGGHKTFTHGDEQWIWTDASETGYINKRGQRFTRILKTLDDKRIAWTKSGKSYYIDEKGNIIKEITQPHTEE